jgi:hypothetical protein
VNGARLNADGAGGSDLSIPSGPTQSSTPGITGQPGALQPGSQLPRGGTNGSGTGGVGGTTGSTKGTGTTAPIKVGFMYTVNDAAKAAGVNNNITIDPQVVTHALVDNFNKAGGFAGRRIEPVYEELRSSSNNFEGDLASACASFTQDNHVAAVISNMGFYSESFMSCLAKAATPVISGDGTDLQNARQFPLMLNPDWLLGDTREIQAVTRLKSAGYLRTGDRVGVVIEDCPINGRIYSNSLAPALQRAGLTIAGTARTQCFQAIGDLGTISGQMGNAVVSFRSKQVSKVMIVSQGQEGTMLFEFMLAASNQRWYPGYALTSGSLATTVQQQPGLSPTELANAHGVGWLPQADSVDPKQAPPSSTARQCQSRAQAEGLKASTPNDFLTLYEVCDTFVLYDAILRATRGNASASTFQQGSRIAGRHFVAALPLGGSTSLWDHGRLGPAEGRLFSYVSSRGGFVYTSNPFRFS